MNQLAAEVQPGQIWLKRVVAEMGGKDAIVVDEEADVDAAALGLAQSAFGFQGQKCSACPRAIVSEKVYDAFLDNTNNPEKIERAKREFFVGNLYINRKCTGAMVGAHPFGGFNMSGTDSKAGGRDYLLLFLQGESVAEKIG